MKQKVVIVAVMLLVLGNVLAQEKDEKSVSLYGNWGFFDQMGGRGPVFIAELDFGINKFFTISPQILTGYGAKTSEINYNSEIYPTYSHTAAVSPGVSLKFKPFPKKLRGLVFVNGISFPIEKFEINYTDPNRESYQTLDYYFNYYFGLDCYLIEMNSNSFGVNLRINTSKNRGLLYSFGASVKFQL